MQIVESMAVCYNIWHKSQVGFSAIANAQRTPASRIASLSPHNAAYQLIQWTFDLIKPHEERTISQPYWYDMGPMEWDGHE